MEDKEYAGKKMKDVPGNQITVLVVIIVIAVVDHCCRCVL